MRPLVSRFLALATSVLLCLLVSEALIRVLDGYSLTRFELVRTAPPLSSRAQRQRVRRHMEEIPLADGVDPAWFSQDPPPLENRGTPPPELRSLVDQIDNRLVKQEFLQVFNAKFAESVFCGWYRETAHKFPGFAFVYDPPDGSRFPRYRHYPAVTTPLGLVTNRWGWRGSDIQLHKPEGMIRIAFIGASTTVNNHSAPFSYPEFVGHWLNLWSEAEGRTTRFESLNLGRAGINSRSIAAVVHHELLPVEPDLVVYYEGSNDFRTVRHLVETTGPTEFDRPPPAPTDLSEALGHSAVLMRLQYSLGHSTFDSSRELPKPSYVVEWPEGLDEVEPDLARGDLPLALSTQLRDFESMRAELEEIGAELVMSSFVLLVSNDLVLDLKRHKRLFDQLNASYWPVSYRDLRRFMDFQNRVYQRYAETRDLSFIDFAAFYPQDPELFIDAVHGSPEGIRLHAWIALQTLVPLLRDRLQAGSLPRSDLEALRQHPAFPMNIRRMPIECDDVGE